MGRDIRALCLSISWEANDPMGQCQASTVSTASELNANEMLVNIKVAPHMGATAETTWEVRVERGATVSALKQQICELYELPLEVQVLRRAVDGPVLSDEEHLVFDKDISFHLSMANPLESFMQALSSGVAGSQTSAGNAGANPMEALMQAMAAGGTPHDPLSMGGAGGFADVLANLQGLQEIVDNTAFTLKFVMPSQGARETEKRCTLEVLANSAVSEVLDMVKLELNVENKNLELEFCGQVLPNTAVVRFAGLGDGDTIKVVPAQAN